MSDDSGPFGYTGKILWVDLSSGNIKEEKPPEEIYRKYLGGYGLGVYYIYRRIKPGCDPLGPDNILAFMPGLLTGTPAPYTGRFMVCGKSPLTGSGKRPDGVKATGGWGDANSGGFFGPAIKRAGYDGIFFTGISEKPVYLLVDKEHISLEEASDLWGKKDTLETEETLKKKYPGANVVSIGKAGENKSLISGIVNDKGRIAARSGLGAVMGSKKLKALCLRGKTRLKIKDPDRARELAKNYNERIRKRLKNRLLKPVLKMAPRFGGLYRRFKIPVYATPTMYAQLFGDYGTPSFYTIMVEVGDTPVKNWKGIGYKDHPWTVAKNFVGVNLLKYVEKKYGCYGCPVRCGAIMNIPHLGLKGVHRPEYETLASFGALLLNGNVDVVFELNEYLNREGMDTISAGVTVAYVMECVEKGLLKKEDFKCSEFPDGFLPEWGASETILPLLRLMVNREGIGDKLADGTRRAAERLGFGKEFAVNANGQELPMHDPRFMQSLAMTYIADPTPGRHTAAGVDFALTGNANAFLKGGKKLKKTDNPVKKGYYQSIAAKNHQWFNALGFCEFAQWMGTYPLIELIESVIGWKMTPEELEEIGWRIQTLRQMFNAREGAIRHEMPKRVINDPPIKKGPLKNRPVDVETMTVSYYTNMGFREDGVPTEETLKKLGLDFCIEDLPNCKGRPVPLINEYLARKKKK